MPGIQTKKQLQAGLSEAFDAVIDYITQQEDRLFDSSFAVDKWTTGQQLEHLIKSVAPLNRGLKLPKFLLKLRFGTFQREEHTYDELVQSYYEALERGGKASKPYIPEAVPLHRKKELLTRYKLHKHNLITILDLWSGEQLSTYQAPHPLLGTLSVRELLFFTICHNYHHLENIKKIS